MEPAIRIKNISKMYSNGVKALRNAALEVHCGEVFGLLGQNGAGKSTLVKILLNLVKPTICQGEMLGKPIGNVATLRRVGYLPEHVRFPDHLTCEDLLQFVGKLHGCAASQARQRGNELLAALGMSQWRSHKIGNFSKGMKQRVGIAQALVNDPDIVFLDEPTDGVDPLGRKEIRELMLDLKRRGKTVFVNSHLLGELEMICDRIAILKQGVVVKQGSLADLTRGDSRYEITVEGNLLDVSAFVSLVTQLGGTVVLSPDARHSTVVVPTQRPQVVQPLIDEIRRSGVIIESITPFRQTLEELFVDVVRHDTPAPPPLRQPEAVSLAN